MKNSFYFFSTKENFRCGEETTDAVDLWKDIFRIRILSHSGNGYCHKSSPSNNKYLKISVHNAVVLNKPLKGF
jgi:hypothetical protein